MDYIWYQADNILDQMNSMKMKLAVILGVSHMTLGICLKGLNSRYFYKSLDFYFEFIPQLALLTVLFGYMNLLIIVKWCTAYPDTSLAPSIITTMIDMFLGMGGVEETALIYSTTTQEIIQMFILLIAFISVPTMLFVKPLILSSELRRKEANELGPCAIELGV
jgi:V-type H+-transporting ATPase subunit a